MKAWVQHQYGDAPGLAMVPDGTGIPARSGLTRRQAPAALMITRTRTSSVTTKTTASTMPTMITW